MITITRLPSRNRHARRGFTLVEIMIGATLSTFILAGVLSTFLFLGRSGANVQNYNDMEAQARKALELFAEDTRQASVIAWSSNQSLTLTVNGASIAYSYSSSARTFTRRTTASTQILVTGITSFAFKAYNISGTELSLTTAAELTTAGKSTKQLQISLESARSSRTVTDATNTVLSARFILRNKRVTT